MYDKGRYYSICEIRFSKAADVHAFYVSKRNINHPAEVVVGHVTVPKTCDARKYILLEVEKMMTEKTLVLEEVPVFIEREGMFYNRQVIGSRI